MTDNNFFEDLPQEIKTRLYGQYSTETIGRSGAGVYVFDNSVLKVASLCSENNIRHEYDAMSFLDGRLNVPQVLAYTEYSGCGYLLMSKLCGKMACNIGGDNRRTARFLANAIRQVIAVTAEGCPRNMTDAERRDLDAAKRNIENGKISGTDLGGFSCPEELYSFLESQKPKPEYFTHGDFCLPNILMDENGKAGFIDLGGAGMGGFWRDIAMCVWSMRYNFSNENICSFETVKMTDYEKEFFDELEISPVEQSINYYLLMGLLF